MLSTAGSVTLSFGSSWLASARISAIFLARAPPYLRLRLSRVFRFSTSFSRTFGAPRTPLRTPPICTLRSLQASSLVIRPKAISLPMKKPRGYASSTLSISGLSTSSRGSKCHSLMMVRPPRDFAPGLTSQLPTVFTWLSLTRAMMSATGTSLLALLRRRCITTSLCTSPRMGSVRVLCCGMTSMAVSMVIPLFDDITQCAVAYKKGQSLPSK